MKTNKDILKSRIERKYAEYKNNILSYDPEDIFALSKQITATTDVLEFIDIIDEEDVEYLLNFKNPLTVLSTAWEDYLENETGGDFCIMLYDLMADDEGEYENDLMESREDEIRIIVETAMEQGKICTLCKLKAMLDELFSECDNDDRGLDSEE